MNQCIKIYIFGTRTYQVFTSFSYGLNCKFNFLDEKISWKNKGVLLRQNIKSQLIA